METHTLLIILIIICYFGFAIIVIPKGEKDDIENHKTGEWSMFMRGFAICLWPLAIIIYILVGKPR